MALYSISGPSLTLGLLGRFSETPIFLERQEFTIGFVAVYLLLGDDEERKARGVEKLRRGREVESYDASEITPEAAVSACNSYSSSARGRSSSSGTSTPGTPPRRRLWWTTWIIRRRRRPRPAREEARGAGEALGGGQEVRRGPQLRAAHRGRRSSGGPSATRGLGLDLPDDVAGSLIERCSGDKQRLVTEMEKLALYVSDRPATGEDLEALCPPDVQSNIFAFVDSLGAGDRGKAIKLLEDLISTGEPRCGQRTWCAASSAWWLAPGRCSRAAPREQRSQES